VQPGGYVAVQISNTGTGIANNLTISTLTLKTVAGTGTVTAISPSLPDNLHSLAAGASITVQFYVNVPSGVTRFLMTEIGTVNDASGNTYSFSGSQVITP
jgi:hypothetical protein